MPIIIPAYLIQDIAIFFVKPHIHLKQLKSRYNWFYLHSCLHFFFPVHTCVCMCICDTQRQTDRQSDRQRNRVEKGGDRMRGGVRKRGEIEKEGEQGEKLWVLVSAYL